MPDVKQACSLCGDGSENGFESRHEPMCRVCTFLVNLREANRCMRRALAALPDEGGSTVLSLGERQDFNQLCRDMSIFWETVDS